MLYLSQKHLGLTKDSKRPLKLEMNHRDRILKKKVHGLALYFWSGLKDVLGV